MRISHRQAQVSDGVWNNSDNSKIQEKGNPSQTKLPRHVVKLEIDPRRNKDNLGKFVNWESLNLTINPNPNERSVSRRDGTDPVNK